jgi:hypothetical protein
VTGSRLLPEQSPAPRSAPQQRRISACGSTTHSNYIERLSTLYRNSERERLLLRRLTHILSKHTTYNFSLSPLHPACPTWLPSRTLNQLPQELVDRVCGYLPAEDLRNTYYVWIKFRKAAQEHAEKHRSWSYTINFDETTVEQRQQPINRYSDFRLRYLKEAQFSPYFPSLETAEPEYSESAEEQRGKDMIFTEQILGLFAALKMMEERAGESRGRYQLTIYTPSQSRSGDECCYHWGLFHWRTHLLKPETFPNLQSVACLQIKDGEMSNAKLDCRLLIDLTIYCPNLNSLVCHIGLAE